MPIHVAGDTSGDCDEPGFRVSGGAAIRMIIVSRRLVAVRMSMMHVGNVAMRMDEPQMAMRMGVRFAALAAGVLMMCVVIMQMIVYQLFVDVQMAMVFAQQRDHADRHQRRRAPVHDRWHRPEDRN